jgi:hypothetical protein
MKRLLRWSLFAATLAAAGLLAGCSTNSRISQEQTRAAVIRLAALSGCDHITRSHPERAATILVDVDAAEESLKGGNVAAVVRQILVRNVILDARDMAYLQEALRLLDLQISSNAIPKPGSDAYKGFLEAFDGCRSGLQINLPVTAT